MELEESMGDIDVLVNNAAISQEEQFERITDDDFNQMVAVNLRAPFLITQSVLPHMQRQRWGRIINIVSIGGQWGGTNQIHYATAKAGLIGLTRSIGKTYGKYGITANAVSPGLVQTEMSAEELSRPDGQAKLRQIPLGRVARPSEVADAVAFLASDKAAYITSQTINVNGGMLFS
jgi:acetoacetyl-CoA reductase/3-oxoacyl-[acyl-carrier protein] reductase